MSLYQVWNSVGQAPAADYTGFGRLPLVRASGRGLPRRFVTYRSWSEAAT